MGDHIKLEREKLYKEVWAEPMLRLGKKYGLTGNGLKKICKKLNVPVPPRGYWARLQHGYKVKKAPLPKLKVGAPVTYTLQANTQYVTEKKQCAEDNLSPEALELIETAQSKANQVSVPLRLTSPHPLIHKTQVELNRIKPDDYGMLRPWRKKYLSLRVSPESLSRALRIMQAILKRFELLGLQVTIETNDYNRFPMTYLHIFDEKFEFTLEEKTLRSDHVPTDKEKKKIEQWSYYSHKKWDFTPTGQLSLRYGVWWGLGINGQKKRWRDTASKKLEDQLTDFIVGGIKIGDAKRRKNLKQQEEERLRRDAYLKWEEAERQRKLELERLQDLENQAEQWHKSQLLRKYIEAVEIKSNSQPNKDANFQNQLCQWLNWAKNHAESLDPLSKGFPER